MVWAPLDGTIKSSPVLIRPHLIQLLNLRDLNEEVVARAFQSRLLYLHVDNCPTCMCVCVRALFSGVGGGGVDVISSLLVFAQCSPKEWQLLARVLLQLVS